MVGSSACHGEELLSVKGRRLERVMRMLSTLPKGIVVNSPEISGDIGRIDQQPVSQEDIAKLWKVYTTTKRKLRDPTAERLENYWWRIWGSRGRNLCGSTVARLFTDISDGHFTAPAWLISSKIAAQAKAQAKTQAQENPAPQRNSSEASLVAPKRDIENGAARPQAPKKNLVMPHPILKKTRGPSAHGPRPTARFISPQETPRISPGASESEKEFFSAEDSPNDHVVVRPPTPEWHDTEEDENVSGAANGKGKRKPPAFTIAAARNKKRPSLLRRKSSQSSTNSDTITKGLVPKRAPAGKILGGVSRHHVISQVMVMQAEDRPKAAVKQQDTAGNAPTIVKNRTQSGRLKKQDSKAKTSEASASSMRPTKLRQAMDNNNEADPDPLTEEELHELNLQQTLLDEANAKMKSSKKVAREPKESRTSEGFQVAHKSLRSKSTSDAGGTQNIAVLALHPKNLKNCASLAPSHGAATGTLELGDNSSDREQGQRLDKGKGRAVDEVQHIEDNAELERGKDMFPKRLVQARPSSTSMVDLSAARGSDALSRSKSQLTLLLEKDRIRTNERAKAVGR